VNASPRPVAAISSMVEIEVAGILFDMDGVLVRSTSGAEEKPGFRTKTVATRITPEELREVEIAAERDGKNPGRVAARSGVEGGAAASGGPDGAAPE